MNWEYTTTWAGRADVCDILNQFGSTGWECFSIYVQPTSGSGFASGYTHQLFFKRALTESKDEEGQ